MSREVLLTVRCQHCAEDRAPTRSRLGRVELDDAGAVWWVPAYPHRRAEPWQAKVRRTLRLDGGRADRVKIADPRLRVTLPDNATVSAWCTRHGRGRVSRHALLNHRGSMAVSFTAQA